jgi:methylmalonyl-CoA/ethylmalonyl-CoA epimerase
MTQRSDGSDTMPEEASGLDPATWRVLGLHHVAFARGEDAVVDDALCDLLGTPHEESAPGFVERMYPVGDAFVQTLQASGDGVIQRYVDRKGPGLHHLAFAVEGIDAAVADLRGRGVRLVDDEPRPGGMGTRIAFVHPSAFGGLLVELVEPPPVAAGSSH